MLAPDWSPSRGSLSKNFKTFTIIQKEQKGNLIIDQVPIFVLPQSLRSYTKRKCNRMRDTMSEYQRKKSHASVTKLYFTFDTTNREAMWIDNCVRCNGRCNWYSVGPQLFLSLNFRRTFAVYNCHTWHCITCQRTTFLVLQFFTQPLTYCCIFCPTALF